ncbi:hypothetical protein QFZ28_001423 [Neobacillus niacini]|jgi:hypothetical protein|uniref:DUF1871 family protein n=1 Tax=Neobacillus niacini TaxID=86668 RepID=UPI002788F98B|nr:DUF1871 family protein [Neobacillus niacini]MDQ1001023.1 hypothetical protein [Neobacillus niacini]
MESEMKTNLQFVDVLNEWDPFKLKNGNYDTEIADTIQAIHEVDNPGALAARIQSIYEFSFERIIPIEQCIKIANKLLLIKDNDSCTI